MKKPRPTCPLCSSPVFVKDPAWISDMFGWVCHLDCIKDTGPGWFQALLAKEPHGDA